MIRHAERSEAPCFNNDVFLIGSLTGIGKILRFAQEDI